MYMYIYMSANVCWDECDEMMRAHRDQIVGRQPHRVGELILVLLHKLTHVFAPVLNLSTKVKAVGMFDSGNPE